MLDFKFSDSFVLSVRMGTCVLRIASSKFQIILRLVSFKSAFSSFVASLPSNPVRHSQHLKVPVHEFEWSGSGQVLPSAALKTENKPKTKVKLQPSNQVDVDAEGHSYALLELTRWRSFECKTYWTLCGA